MSYAKSTENYGLPDYVLSDTPDWVADIAKAFEKIDMVMKANADGIVTVNGAVETLNSALSTISESIDNLEENLGNIPDEVASIKSEVDSLSQNLADIRVLSGENSTAITNLTAQFSTHLSKFAEWQNMVNDYRGLQTSAVRQLFNYNAESHPNETGEPLFALKTEIPKGLQFIMEDVSSIVTYITQNSETPLLQFNKKVTGLLILSEIRDGDRMPEVLGGNCETWEGDNFVRGITGAIGAGFPANTYNIVGATLVVGALNGDRIRLQTRGAVNNLTFKLYLIGNMMEVTARDGKKDA